MEKKAMESFDIDRQSLSDLDIFSEDPSKASVFALADTTKTTDGKYRLKSYFSSPKKRIADISAMQQTLKFILRHFDDFDRCPLSDDLVYGVKDYLRSNIIPVSSLKKRVILGEIGSYPEIDFAVINKGVHAVRRLLLSVLPLNRVFEADATPEHLATFAQGLTGLLSDGTVKSLLESAGQKEIDRPDAFFFDKMFREGIKNKLEAFVEQISSIDALSSMAGCIKRYGLNFPRFIEDGEVFLSIKGLFHPFLQNPVRNDVSFPGKTNLLFLTGANMSGKTTYIKACGIAVYLAHIGMGVPAEEMALTTFDILFVSINPEGNIQQGYSFFYSEVLRVKTIAAKLGKGARALVIFDEVFRGTNVKDAFDCTLLITRGFARSKGGIFMLSSHLSELETEIQSIPSIVMKCFDATIENGKPCCSYRLRKGVSHARHGLFILKNEGIPGLLGCTNDGEDEICREGL